MESEVVKGSTALLAGPTWDLVRRVAASANFQKSPRLQELLLDICERALLNLPEDLREQSIGCRVFARQPDYNPSEDNIVRVEVRRLRKRLEEYFTSEGAHEQIVISIPKGSYVPVFQPREAVLPPARFVVAEAISVPSTPGPGARTRWPWAVLAIMGVFVLLGLWLRTEYWPPRPSTRSDLMSSKGRAPLWPILFNADQDTLIVCADSALVVAHVLRGIPVPLDDYIRRDYIGNLSPPEDMRRALSQVAGWQMTDLADVRLVDRLHRSNPDAWTRTSIRTARTTQVHDFATGNVILLGSTRSNPWHYLFEQQLNFRIEWNGRPIVRNKAPMAGEQALYQTTGSVEYGTIAFVPNLRRIGHVLMIAGTNGLATEAVGEYITSAPSYSRLMKLLASRNGGELPYFEALLRSRILAGVPEDVELVATRIILPGPAGK